jgi:hypothetical protein
MPRTQSKGSTPEDATAQRGIDADFGAPGGARLTACRRILSFK